MVFERVMASHARGDSLPQFKDFYTTNCLLDYLSREEAESIIKVKYKI